MRPNDHKVLSYRMFKNFSEELFLRDLKTKTSLKYCRPPIHADIALDLCYDKFVNTLNKHAPTIYKRVKQNVQPKWHKTDFEE